MTTLPKKNIAARLQRCMQTGRLTIADLQHFFRRPYPTIRSWIKKAAIPRDPKTPQLLADLAKLEKLVQRRKANLVPFDVLFVDRPAFMAKLNGHKQPASAASKSRPSKRSKAKRKLTSAQRRQRTKALERARIKSARRAREAQRKRKPAGAKARTGSGAGDRPVAGNTEAAAAG